MFNKMVLVSILAFGLFACESDETSVPAIQCASGTVLNETGDACEANLGDGIVINMAGQIVIDPDVVAENERTLADQLDEARTEGRNEGIESVTPLNCAEGTTENEAGDACEPTEEYRAAAVEEGRLAGVASVTPLRCADGAGVNEAGDACEPTAEYRAAAVEEGRLAGVASVVPLRCDDGASVNSSGDACEPNLSDNVTINDDETIVPTTTFAAGICEGAGGNYSADTGICDPAVASYSCFRGGFCAEAARLGLEVEPHHLGVLPEQVGCTDSQEGMESWSVGTELAFRSTASLQPGSPEWRSFALRLWLCR